MEDLKKTFERFHRGEPVKVLVAACNTAGISIEDICQIVEKRSGKFEDLNHITVGDWFHVCGLLKIDIDSLSWGYSPYIHKRCIGQAIYESNYFLPMTIEAQNIFTKYKKEMRQERKNQLKTYGGSLRRRIRLDYLKKDVEHFFTKLTKPKIAHNLSSEWYS
jgi:hypothetical protein